MRGQATGPAGQDSGARRLLPRSAVVERRAMHLHNCGQHPSAGSWGHMVTPCLANLGTATPFPGQPQLRPHRQCPPHACNTGSSPLPRSHPHPSPCEVLSREPMYQIKGSPLIRVFAGSTRRETAGWVIPASSSVSLLRCTRTWGAGGCSLLTPSACCFGLTLSASSHANSPAT